MSDYETIAIEALMGIKEDTHNSIIYKGVIEPLISGYAYEILQSIDNYKRLLYAVMNNGEYVENVRVYH